MNCEIHKKKKEKKNMHYMLKCNIKKKWCKEIYIKYKENETTCTTCGNLI